MKKTLFAIGVSFAILLMPTMLSKSAKASEISDQEKFFNEYGDIARKVANENDLYASVMLAQMALESNYGKSGLSKKPIYNFFGIKGSYKGKSVLLNTNEDDGQGNLYTIKANFRKYQSPADSMQDYADLINNSGYYTNATKTNAPTYKDAIKAIHGVYATDTQYGNKLNYIISTYNLEKYDFYKELNLEELNLIEYVILKGDTLSKISEKYEVDLEEIKYINNIYSDLIVAGETILIPVEENLEIFEDYEKLAKHLKNMNYLNILNRKLDLNN